MRKKLGSLIFALALLGGSLVGVFTPRNAEAACCHAVEFRACRNSCASQGCTGGAFCNASGFCQCICEC